VAVGDLTRTHREPPESVAVSRADFGVVVVVHTRVRLECGPEWVVARQEAAEAESRVDDRQHVVAAEEQPVGLVVQADRPSGVTGGGDDPHDSPRDRQQVTVVEHDIRRESRRLRPRQRDGVHLVEPILGNAPASDRAFGVGVERAAQRVMFRPMHRDRDAVARAQTRRQPEVVGMKVRRRHGSHVAETEPRDRQCGFEPGEVVGGIPARIEEVHTTIGISDRVAQRALDPAGMRQRQGNRPHAVPHLLDGGGRAGEGRAVLRDARRHVLLHGDSNLATQPASSERMTSTKESTSASVVSNAVIHRTSPPARSQS
jgi:hypothetical protein